MDVASARGVVDDGIMFGLSDLCNIVSLCFRGLNFDVFFRCMGYVHACEQNSPPFNTIFRYHSIKDQRIPAKFICFDCRIRADSNWDLIKIDLYPKVISKLKELALFRSVFTLHASTGVP